MRNRETSGEGEGERDREKERVKREGRKEGRDPKRDKKRRERSRNGKFNTVLFIPINALQLFINLYPCFNIAELL